MREKNLKICGESECLHVCFIMLGSYTSITYHWFFFRCNCGECSSEYLQNLNEFQCCLEIEECVECLSSEMVIEEVGTKPKCVTQHPGFGQVCLQKWSLRLAADKYKTKTKTKQSIARLVWKTGRYKLFKKIGPQCVLVWDFIRVCYGLNK